MKNKKTSGLACIELIVIITIIALLGTLIGTCIYDEKVRMPKAFAAWEKQTGNEKHLTFDEWRILMKANERQNDTTFIFIPQ